MGDYFVFAALAAEYEEKFAAAAVQDGPEGADLAVVQGHLEDAGGEVVDIAEGNGRFRPLAKSAIDSVFVRISQAAGPQRPIRSQALRHRLGDLTTRKYGAKVAALLLNHKEWQPAATALTFYHHPEESDISQAIAAVGECRAQDEMYRLFGVEKG